MKKQHNEYEECMPDLPKAVACALVLAAYSDAAFAFPEGDDGECADIGSDVAFRRIAYAWQRLHCADIVPQPVNSAWRKYLTADDIA